MSLITLKNLRVFRGTYAEIQEKETEDKTIYLAWDTQEIYIGNARGVKVKYGGSKNLEMQLDNRFEEFKAELNELIASLAEETVNTKIEAAIDNFDTTYRSELQSIRNQVTEINNSVESNVTQFQTNINTELNTFKGNVQEQLAGFNSAIEQNAQTLETLSSSVEAISSNTTRIGALESSVSGLQNAIGDLSTASSGHIGYMTGNAMEEFFRNHGTSEFKPTLCISDSTNYSAGVIYYYNGEEIVEANSGSGSGSSSTTITGELYVSLNPTGPICVSNEPLSLEVTLGMSNAEAINKSTIVMNIDGNNISYAEGQAVYTVNGLSRSLPRTLYVSTSASANPKPNRKTEYAVSASGGALEIYAPILFGTEGAISEGAYTYGDIQLTYSAIGEYMYIYSYSQLSAFHFGDNVDDDAANDFYDGLENRRLSNGAEIAYNRYKIGPFYAETDIIIKR